MPGSFLPGKSPDLPGRNRCQANLRLRSSLAVLPAFSPAGTRVPKILRSVADLPGKKGYSLGLIGCGPISADEAASKYSELEHLGRLPLEDLKVQIACPGFQILDLNILVP